ncbi:Uncharacterised protein [Mycobacteroides abscessus subsp. abscessus]|nr:Uncharacterised protein [Mycobacteroides abscessus subsp. abscessus]
MDRPVIAPSSVVAANRPLSARESASSSNSPLPETWW